MFQRAFGSKSHGHMFELESISPNMRYGHVQPDYCISESATQHFFAGGLLLPATGSNMEAV